MTDGAAGSTAWRVAPERYLEAHPPQFPAGSETVSRYITVRDGTRIALDVHLPRGRAEDEQFPTLTVLTPYYRRFALVEPHPPDVEASPGAAAYRDFFVPQGYAMVVVDVRGTGASFGTRDGFRSPVERDDYADLADWIVAQPWSDGRIGALGVSYVGAAADFLASTGHPAVEAVAPTFAVWDTYRDHYYPGGLLLNRLAPAYQELMEALDHDRRDLLAKFPYFADPHFAGPAAVDDDPDGILLRAAIREHLASFEMPDFIRQFPFADATLPYDPEYGIAHLSPYFYAAHTHAKVAYLCVSGWMDGGGFANGAINRFRSLRTANRHLLLGPWDHGARTNVSPFRTSPHPDFPLLAEYLRFFNTYLRNENTGLAEEAPVHFFIMGEERWQEATTWPPPAVPVTLHLAADCRLDETAPNAVEGFDVFRADYTCGTGAQTRYERLSAQPVEHYYADWHGRDEAMLRWTSPPLERAITLAGHPVATLHIAASERDAGLFLYLEDVAPDGTCRYVTEGVFRALHRKVTEAPWNLRSIGPYHSFAKADAQPLMPGEAVEIAFALLPTAWRFAVGHRLRLALAAADRDHFARVPDGRPPELRIFRETGRASRIELPVLP